MIDDQTVVALVRTVVVVGQLLRCQSIGVGSINVSADILDVRIDHGWIDEAGRRYATVVRPETLRWRRLSGRRRFLSTFCTDRWMKRWPRNERIQSVSQIVSEYICWIEGLGCSARFYLLSNGAFNFKVVGRLPEFWLLSFACSSIGCRMRRLAFINQLLT